MVSLTRSTKSTRSRVRSASESQSQSQSRPKVTRDDIETLESLPEESAQTFASGSTASLPPDFAVYIGLPPGAQLTKVKAREYEIRGQELLADGWRRNDPEGRLDDLRSRTRAKKAAISVLPCNGQVSSKHEKPGHAGKDPKVLWYTAGLRYPCKCELTTLRGSWRPRHRPPLSLDLPSLPTEASISIVPVGNDLLDWSHRPESDLDPGLDAIPDFQTSWHVATGKGWIHDEPAGTSKAGRITPESAKTAVEDESSQTRRIRKGKFKALNPLHTSMTIIAEPIDPPDVPLDALEVPTVLRPVVNQATGHHESALGLIVEPPSAREKPGSWPSPRSRKAWWREEIGSSSSYGRIWEILPRPHVLDILPPQSKKRRTTSIPDFVLPKSYQTSTDHPFHPHVQQWLKMHPRDRVYWLIPIHGPVHIPSYFDHEHDPSFGPKPSPAILGKSLPKTSSDMPMSSPSAFGVPIHWTPKLAEHFWTAFLRPCHVESSRPFGDFSVRVSGPKPDPFIDLPEPAPLPAWEDGRQPSRVEAGDHLRVYMDAKYALRFRTWLRGIEIEEKVSPYGKEKVASQGDSEESSILFKEDAWIRPFERARLTLVGMKGEVLVVA